MDVWRRREETMRMLRWASEHAASSDDAKARMGIAALDALSDSELLQEQDQALVDAVIDSLLEEPLEEIEALGDDVEVVEVDDDPEGQDSDYPTSEGDAAMPKVVKVTPAQVNAAKLKVKRSTATGRYVKTSVSQIANAKRATETHRHSTRNTGTSGAERTS